AVRFDGGLVGEGARFVGRAAAMLLDRLLDRRGRRHGVLLLVNGLLANHMGLILRVHRKRHERAERTRPDDPGEGYFQCFHRNSPSRSRFTGNGRRSYVTASNQETSLQREATPAAPEVQSALAHM